MDWIKSVIRFKYTNGGTMKTCKFDLVHFDNIEYPIVKGEVWDNDGGHVCTGRRLQLEPAESLLGSVLWLDAINLFLPYVCTDISTLGDDKLSCICLGEGTGACGVGLAATELFSRVVISDLPPLVPLLDLNAQINDPLKIEAQELDWTEDPSAANFENAKFNIIIGCEVLYGNRFVWDDLISVITRRVTHNTVVYICVTLRNARHDLEDFWKKYLSKFFHEIIEIPLSDTVSVLRASIPNVV